MALFDFFKRKPVLPATLREALIEAAHRQDFKSLADLCQKHREEIKQEFPKWRILPAELQKDPAALNKYAQGLIAVAQLFENSGDAGFLKLLTGDDADNPIILWQQDLEKAQSLLDTSRPAEAIQLLLGTLERTKGLTGTGVEQNLPRTLGSLGAAYFQAGDKAKAVEFTQRALEACEKTGDQEGVRIYRGNLQHIATASGGSAGPGEANRVEYTQAGKKTSDITALEDGTASYRVVGKGTIPRKAEQLHQEARAKGQAGDYEAATNLLNQAIAIAPDWAYPHYDLAFTHLLQGNSAKALEKYQEADRLKPDGFFTAKTAIWCLEREAKGMFPQGTYLAYVSLEWAPPDEKKEMIERMTRDLPSFAPAWKEKALLCQDPSQRLHCIQKALTLDPDPETYGILILNKAALLHSTGQTSEAQQMAEELVRSQTATTNSKALGKELLRTFTK